MRFVLDIDGMLCDEEHEDLSKRTPYMDRIAYINKLYDDGHGIDIFTSRGMKSCNNDQILSDLKYRDLTEQQLASWGLKYNNLYFGKPNADFYIDNKNMLMQDFFNQR